MAEIRRLIKLLNKFTSLRTVNLRGELVHTEVYTSSVNMEKLGKIEEAMNNLQNVLKEVGVKFD